MLALAAEEAAGQGQRFERRTALSFQVGTEPKVSGTFIHTTESGGRFGTRRAFEQSFSDLYSVPLRLAVEISHTLVKGPELAIRFDVTDAGSRGEVEFSEAITLDTPPRRIVSLARFGDYTSATFEGAARWRFLRHKPIQPYVGAIGGLALVRRITIAPAFLVGESGGNAGFYARSAVPTIGALFGSSVFVRPRLALVVESGIRHQRALHPQMPQGLSRPWSPEIYSGSRRSMSLSGGIQFWL